MRREVLLVAEIIDSAERIVALTSGLTVALLDEDRNRREALLWSFTVLGEASSQLDDDLKSRFPQVQWRAAAALRNRIVHGYWQNSTSILLATAQDDMLRSLRPFERSRRRSPHRGPNRRTIAPLSVGRPEKEPARLAWVH